MIATRYVICSTNEDYIFACKERVQEVSANLETATLSNATRAFSQTWNVLLDRHVWAESVPGNVFDDYLAEARNYETVLHDSKVRVSRSIKRELDHHLSIIHTYIGCAQTLKEKILASVA